VKSAFKVLGDLESTYGSVIQGAIKKANASKANPKRYSGKMFSFDEGFSLVIKKLAEALGHTLDPKEEARVLTTYNAATGEFLSTEPTNDAVEHALSEAIDRHDALYSQCGSALTRTNVTALTQTESGWNVDCWIRGKPTRLTFTHLVLAVPAPNAASLLEPIDNATANRLRQIPYSPVAQVMLAFEKGDLPSPEGFGFLVPEVENEKILGAVFNSSIFPSRYNRTVFTVFIGGSRQPELAQRASTELTELAETELKKILRLSAPSVTQAAAAWVQAIPQYRIGHADILNAVSDFETNTRTIFLTGNWRGGISVPDTIEHAEQTASRVMASLRF
jgi:protoporphyrinogen oxidase